MADAACGTVRKWIGGVEGFVMARTYTHHIDADGKLTFAMKSDAFQKMLKNK